MRSVACLVLLLIGSLTASACAQAARPAAFLTGVDANYALDMEAAGHRWTVDGATGDPFAQLARAGVDSIRIRLWTGNAGPSGLDYAIRTAQRAQAAGLKPYLVIFLSDDWADMVKQPVPAIWKGLPFDQKCAAVEAYAERVTRRFAHAGVDVDLFEIGNEIDFGLCGEFEAEWPKRVSLDSMRANVWPRMTPIIAAAQRGVRKARPDARFVLHLAQWANAEYCIAFWRHMLDSGVAVDLAGLSYFPSSTAKPDETPLPFLARQAATIRTAIGRPVLICETAFPSQPSFTGQFADWNKPVQGYAFDTGGQRRWLTDLLALTRADASFAGTFYWSPEWYRSGMWEAFALYDENGVARPAIGAFSTASPTTAPTTQPAPTASPSTLNVYFGNLHAHTALSDGTGTAEEAYAYARDVAKLDFLALTEHNHLLGGDKATPDARVRLYSGPQPTGLIPSADRNDRPGTFVALYGQEFSSMSKGNHVNVFDVSAVIQPADVPNGDFAKLLAWMDANRDSTGAMPVLQFNHPMLGPPGKGIPANEYGRDDFGGDANWVAKMGAVTSLVEVLNGEPEGAEPAGRAPQVMEAYYLAYLQRGFRLAPTGNQDNHKKQWGTITDVRTAILAPELTRASLLAAMRARHVYATEDKNLRIVARVNGHLMGDVIETSAPIERITLSIELTDPDEPTADYAIDVFAGAIGGDRAAPVTSIHLKGNATLSLEPANAKLAKGGDYLFLRITQTSGHATPDRTWTAPVWVQAPAAR